MPPCGQGQRGYRQPRQQGGGGDGRLLHAEGETLVVVVDGPGEEEVHGRLHRPVRESPGHQEPEKTGQRSDQEAVAEEGDHREPDGNEHDLERASPLGQLPCPDRAEGRGGEEGGHGAPDGGRPHVEVSLELYGEGPG